MGHGDSIILGSIPCVKTTQLWSLAEHGLLVNMLYDWDTTKIGTHHSNKK